MSSLFMIFSTMVLAGLALTWLGHYAPLYLRTGSMFGVLLLLAVSAFIGKSGWLARFDSLPPPFMIYMAGNFLLMCLLVFSSFGRDMAEATPLRVLIGLQAFRILPELLLHLSWQDGLAPIQMTFHGKNFDIVTAIFSGILYLMWNRLTKPHVWAWIQTLVGLTLVTTIVTIAILSAPLPFRVFMNEPANTFVTRFPYVWLPGIHVFAAYLWHGITIRKLIRERGKSV